jgi:hypothetical protein
MPRAEAQGLQAMRLSVFHHPPKSSAAEGDTIERYRRWYRSM